jgi:hypothetical protein
MRLPTGWTKSKIPWKWERKLDDFYDLIIVEQDDEPKRKRFKLYVLKFCGSIHHIRYAETLKELLGLSKEITPENWRSFIRY